MNQRRFSRRIFLSGTSDAARGSCIVLTLPMVLAACSRSNQARLDSAALQTLGEEEALEFSAIAARIIPSDDLPGATEAGVIYFIDTVLADNRGAEYAIMQAGLKNLQQAVSSNYNSNFFHLLEVDQQDALLRDIEQSEFFSTIRFLTIAGTFSHPDYGGNREQVGNRLLGFDDRHAWQPPFGAYDADYAEKGE